MPPRRAAIVVIVVIVVLLILVLVFFLFFFRDGQLLVPPALEFIVPERSGPKPAPPGKPMMQQIPLPMQYTVDST